LPPPEPVPLHRVTLADLMDSPSASPEWEASIILACADPAYEDARIGANPIARHLMAREDHGRYVREVAFDVPAFTCVVPARRAHAQFMAVIREATGEVVAGIHDRNIYVLPAFRGRGIGAELLVRAFETGQRHPETMNRDNSLTTAGRANRRAAHRLAVTRALDAGEEVPDDVMADYPDLAGPGPRP